MAVVEVACPGCKAGLKAPDSMAGKKARCKKCGTAFVIPGGTGEPAGDSQMLSAVEVPAAPAAVAAAPAAKPAPKPAPAAPPPPAPVAKAKPAPPPPPPVEEEELPAEVVAEEPAAGDPFAFDGPAAGTAADPFAFGSDEPAAAPAPPPAPKAKGKAAPPPPPPPPAEDDPFSFGGGDAPVEAEVAAEPPPPKAKGKAKPAPKPAPPPDADEEDDLAAPAAPAAYNPFDSFDPGPAVAEEEVAPDLVPAKAKAKGKGKGKADEADEPEKPSYRNPAKQKSKALLYTMILGGLAVAIGLAAVVRVMKERQAEKDEIARKERDKRDKEEEEKRKNDFLNKPNPDAPPPAKAEPEKPAPPPVPGDEPVAKKDVTPKKGEKGAAPKKGSATPKKGGGEAGVAPTLTLKGGRAVPAVMKLGEHMIEPEKADKALGLGVPFAAVKQVFPPTDQSDLAVLYEDGKNWVLERFSPNDGKSTGKDVTVLADGPAPAADCTLADKAERFALVLGGRVNIWSLTDKKQLVERFDPYESAPDQKAAGLAAVFLTEKGDRFATVSGAGAVHLFETATKKPLGGAFVPKTKSPHKVVAGKSAAVEPGRKTVLVAVGGTIYRVRIDGDAPAGDEVATLGGDPAASLALAGAGSDGGIVYAFEADKKEKWAAVFAEGKQEIFKWPAGVGDPVSAGWVESDRAGVGTSTGGVLWFHAAEGRIRPLSLVVTDGKAVHLPAHGRHWFLLPSASDPAKRSVLVQLGTAGGPIDPVERPKGTPTYRADDKGLSTGK